MSSRHLAVIAFAMLAPLAGAHAQTATTDTLRLGTLQASAIRRDPRARELELLAAQSRLRQRNLDSERRPAFLVESQAQYQSDVAQIPIVLPGGVMLPGPSHDTYDAHVSAQQRLSDPSRASRRAVENAQLAEAQSRLRVALFSVRQNVSDVFFASLRAQSQMSELQTTITDLEAQSRAAGARVREGSALPGEELAIRVELLRRRQLVAEWRATRRASLDVLGDFTGQALDSVAVLDTPDLSAEVARARTSLTDVRARAEYEQFARARGVLERQEQLRVAQEKPRVSAFGRVGYGRPGLNPLSDKFNTYWLTGVQLQWTPWNWGTTDRDRELLVLQRQAISVEEQSFTDNLRRGIAQDLATIDRLGAALSADDEIVVLRERIAGETRARFAEGVITSAEYVDRETDVLSARIARSLHRVELAQARARFLTTLGIEVR